MLRSVTAKDLSFWRAYEEVEGPIGYGPLIKVAAWLGWTQCDGSKVGPADVLGWIEGFLDPADEMSDDDVDDETPETRRERTEWKLMRMFGHPELKKGE